MTFNVDKFIKDNNLELDEYEKAYLEKIFNIPSLTAKETRDLFVKYRENNDEVAKRVIIESNLKYLPFIAKSYLNIGVSFWDLFQSGYEGLEKALKMYEPNTKKDFRSYSYMWIRAYMIFAIPFNRTIRIPYSFYKKEKRFFYEFYEKNAVISEMANSLNLSEDDVQKKLELMKTTTSLEEMLEENFDCNNYYFIDDPFEEEVLEKIDMNVLKKYIEKFLTEEELDILKLRFGFYNDRCFTMPEIAKRYNTNKQRIHYVINCIIKKIKNDILNMESYKFIEITIDEIINKELSKIKEDDDYNLLIDSYLNKVYLEYGSLGRKIMNLKINFPNLSLERIAYFTGATKEKTLYIMEKGASFMESSFKKNKTYKIN